MSEGTNSKLIQLAVSKHTNSTLWRNNTGTGWVGKTKRSASGGIYIEEPRPLHAGLCIGSSDFIGLSVREITPEMVGKKIAIFTAVEVKKNKGSHTSPEQLNFIDFVRKNGGIAGIAKSPEEAVNLLNTYNEFGY